MQQNIRTDISREEILPTAECMRKQGRALVMIHGFMDKQGQMIVSYDYMVDGNIESYQVTGEMNLPSIGQIYDTAATWPERELNELFGLKFEGLDTSKRLFLPEDMLETQGRGQIMVTPLSELVEKNLKED